MPPQRAQELYQRLAYRAGWTAPPPADVVLDMFVLYDRPFDAPNHFVARRWFVVRGQLDSVPGESKQAETLADVRALLPVGKHRLDRHLNDDPKIVEVWV